MPDGVAPTYTYNARGYNTGFNFDSINNANYSKTITSTGAFGIESFNLNGTVHTREYDPLSGRVLKIYTQRGVSSLQKLRYHWFSNKNVKRRTKGGSVEDEFKYDELNRLEEMETTLGSQTRTLDFGYDKFGNFTAKTSSESGDTDVTNYAYGAGVAGPHAVTSATVGGHNYTLGYNSSGAVTSYTVSGDSSKNKTLAYNASGQPVKITQGANANSPDAMEEFRYGADGKRYYKKSTYQQGSTTRVEHTFYVGKYEKTYYDASGAFDTVSRSRFVDVEIMRRTPLIGNVNERILGVYTDSLGSVDIIIDINGNVKSDMEFDPFGARRDQNMMGDLSQSGIANLLSNLTELPNRGFTGHEMLDRINLIHMNGRIYDPTLGRFLTPDPLVQAPHYSQSWNRYTYVFNNPMRYIDPTGYNGTSYGCARKDDQDSKCKDEEPKKEDTKPDVEEEEVIVTAQGGKTDKQKQRESIRKQLMRVSTEGYRRVGESTRNMYKRFSREMTLDLDKAKLIGKQELAKRPLAHNDLGDALRHANWNKRMVEEINLFTAIVAGIGHEIEGSFLDGNFSEGMMDLHNNAVGRKAGSDGVPINNQDLITSPGEVYE